MEQAEKNQIVIAALSAAGPTGDDAEAWNGRVLEPCRPVHGDARADE